MTTEVLYQCSECGQAYESEVRADRLDSCRVTNCPGKPGRVWRVINFTRVPGGAREKG